MLECFLCLLFDIRAEWALYLLTQPADYGSIAYEYEKNAYPLALADVWAANADSQAALAFLQQADSQADETFGIDLYSGFVLKGQMRKYFEFGELLEPAYRDRMYRAMDWLTETDPLSRPANPPRKFWAESTDNCATLVDCRNTDNLRAMRDTAVYLMAEETGNEATQQIYKARLERYVSTLLDIGMGEWDSPTYHSHTTAAYLNLDDFARDPEVKAIARSGLDWLFFSAALKYWRGTWAAPAKRLNGDGSERFFWLYFGDANPPEAIENDWIHALTTAYQPPDAVLRLARREFPKPLEIRRTHPHYENWKPELYGPAFYETLYFGHTFQLGSLVKGTAGDWQGFALHLLRGAAIDTLRLQGGGSHRIAQYRNLMIWQGESMPQMTFPDGSQETVQNITFIKTEQTWLALSSLPQGFVLEVGEVFTHGTFEQFKASVLDRSRLIRQPDKITYRGSQGRTIVLGQPTNDALPPVWRDDVLHDWAQHTHLEPLCQALQTGPDASERLHPCTRPPSYPSTHPPSYPSTHLPSHPSAALSNLLSEPPKFFPPARGILGIPLLTLSEQVYGAGDRSNVAH